MKHVTVEWAGTDVAGQKQSGTITVELPESIAEAIDVWGEDRLLDLACRQAITDARNKARAQACGRRESETTRLAKEIAKALRAGTLDPSVLEALRTQAGLDS